MGTVVRLAETRAMLNALGPRPDEPAVDEARRALSVIDSYLASELQEIVARAPPDAAVAEAWKMEQEAVAMAAAEEERLPYKSVIHLDELHRLYSGMLRSAESGGITPPRSPMRPLYISDDVDADVVLLLQSAHDACLSELLLAGRKIERLPESVGKITSLVHLNLSANLLKVLPKSITRLSNLVTLDVSSNSLISLPEDIGQLKKLEVLNVSGNSLRALPESLGQCYSLSELNANFNQLEKLPSSIGFLFCLTKLSLQFNKLNLLPSSICDLASLKSLEVHFNQLLALPAGIGKLRELEHLNCSSNFRSLTTLPSSMGDLCNLTELDLSYNQIRELPNTCGRLCKLRHLKLEENPLVVPPPEVVEHSLEAILQYMAERWRSSLALEGDEAMEATSSPARQLTSPARSPLRPTRFSSSPLRFRPSPQVHPVHSTGRSRRTFIPAWFCGASSRMWQQHRADAYLEQL